MTFLLSEDDALHTRLQGMVVTDQKAVNQNTPRQVGVWFGQPDQELRAQSYPYVTIDMIDVERDPSREMRGKVSPDYLKPADLATNKGFIVDIPIPVNITYQITTYARHPRHDRAIMAQLMFDKLPIRFGSLDLDDGTVRRLDVLGVSKRDVTEQAKRLFVNAVTVQVSSEVAQSQITELYKTLSVAVHEPALTRMDGRIGDHTYWGPGEFTTTA